MGSESQTQSNFQGKHSYPLGLPAWPFSRLFKYVSFTYHCTIGGVPCTISKHVRWNGQVSITGISITSDFFLYWGYLKSFLLPFCSIYCRQPWLSHPADGRQCELLLLFSCTPAPVLNITLHLVLPGVFPSQNMTIPWPPWWPSHDHLGAEVTLAL